MQLSDCHVRPNIFNIELQLHTACARVRTAVVSALCPVARVGSQAQRLISPLRVSHAADTQTRVTCQCLAEPFFELN